MAKLKASQRVTLKIAEERALDCLVKAGHYGMVKANMVALAIWPDNNMTSQGAGAAASRVLKSLEKKKLARWKSSGGDWGWTYGS